MSQAAKNEILKRMDLSDDVVFSAVEILVLSTDLFGKLIGKGIFEEIKPSKIVQCDGCEELCIQEVVFSTDSVSGVTRAFIVCDKREEIGRIEVSLDDLKQWQLNMEKFSQWLSQQMHIEDPGYSIISNRLWWLGKKQVDNKQVDFFLFRGLARTDAEQVLRDVEYIRQCKNPLLLVPFKTETNLPYTLKGKIISLDRLLNFSDSGIELDFSQIESILRRMRTDEKRIIKKFPTPSNVSWEDVTIEFLSDREVLISAFNVREKVDYEEMGLDKPSGQGLTKPTNLWELLVNLAKIESNPKLNTQQIYKIINPVKDRKNISRLRTKLKSYFGLEDEPFYSTKEIGYYKPKFKLVWPVHLNCE